jgi:hypothetical protein
VVKKVQGVYVSKPGVERGGGWVGGVRRLEGEVHAGRQQRFELRLNGDHVCEHAWGENKEEEREQVRQHAW